MNGNEIYTCFGIYEEAARVEEMSLCARLLFILAAGPAQVWRISLFGSRKAKVYPFYTRGSRLIIDRKPRVEALPVMNC